MSDGTFIAADQDTFAGSGNHTVMTTTQDLVAPGKLVLFTFGDDTHALNALNDPGWSQIARRAANGQSIEVNEIYIPVTLPSGTDFWFDSPANHGAAVAIYVPGGTNVASGAVSSFGAGDPATLDYPNIPGGSPMILSGFGWDGDTPSATYGDGWTEGEILTSSFFIFKKSLLTQWFQSGDTGGGTVEATANSGTGASPAWNGAIVSVPVDGGGGGGGGGDDDVSTLVAARTSLGNARSDLRTAADAFHVAFDASTSTAASRTAIHAALARIRTIRRAIQGFLHP